MILKTMIQVPSLSDLITLSSLIQHKNLFGRSQILPNKDYTIFDEIYGGYIMNKMIRKYVTSRVIRRTILKLMFILMLCVISSFVVTTVNVLIFDGTIGKNLLLLIHFVLGGFVGFFVSRHYHK